ncbi:MAG: nitrate reductase [Gemmatimonas sp.]|nr:nitrate reductase [Gemmatimonas sp.]
MFAPRDRGSDEGRQRIRAWVEASFGLAPDDTVLVTELRCHEPGCPPVETVIGILRPGHDTRQFKIGKAPLDVSREEIVALARGDQ